MIYFTMAVYSVPISQHRLFKMCVFSPFEQKAPPAMPQPLPDAIYQYTMDRTGLHT